MKLDTHLEAIRSAEPIPVLGRVTGVAGLGLEAHVHGARVGSLCDVFGERGDRTPAEVVGFRGDTALLMPLGPVRGHGTNSLVRTRDADAEAAVGPELLGRVVDAFGDPLDGLPPPRPATRRPLHAEPPEPLARRPIEQVLDLGVRSLNALAPCGRGQRMAIVAGSGVGKSTLLGMIARYSEADVKVVALIGERGREVREFIERDLGDALASSLVVVATSDTPALARLRAAYLALAAAEHFRAEGRQVLFLMDALTRFATAQREVGLAAGEPPTAKGYPPSIFSMLPRFLERIGNDGGPGSMTGLFTVLAEEDDFNDPVVDAVRAVTDGQVVLSRDLALRNHYPAINVGHTISRSVLQLAQPEHLHAAGELRALIAELERVQDLVDIGAYKPGGNPRADRALLLREAIELFLRQSPDEAAAFEDSRQALFELTSAGEVPR